MSKLIKTVMCELEGCHHFFIFDNWKDNLIISDNSLIVFRRHFNDISNDLIFTLAVLVFTLLDQRY